MTPDPLAEPQGGDGAQPLPAAPGPAPAIDQGWYLDGQTNRKRRVEVRLGDLCELIEDGKVAAAWPFEALRRVDAPAGLLRVSCLSAPPLARLEIADNALAARLSERCARLDDDVPGRKGTGRIVAWSLAALASILLVVTYGVPFAAERLTPLIPASIERQLGDASEKQIDLVFGGKVCTGADGEAAFRKLVTALRTAAGMDASVDAVVLSTSVPNAFALPGGKIYLFNGLLSQAHNSDEIAGVLAHELGHVRHRDGLRNMIYNGGTSFMVGLLFGDVTGSSTLIFASRTFFGASYSREAEASADAFSIDVMHTLGRSPRPMGELLFRITGNEKDKNLSFLSNHPLTEDRLAAMREADRPPTAPPILSDEEWLALRNVCK